MVEKVKKRTALSERGWGNVRKVERLTLQIGLPANKHPNNSILTEVGCIPLPLPSSLPLFVYFLNNLPRFVGLFCCPEPDRAEIERGNKHDGNFKPTGRIRGKP
jgi:hypothetical protein